jgi:hypothetical protein
VCVCEVVVVVFGRVLLLVGVQRWGRWSREAGGEVTWKWRSGGGVGRVVGRVDGEFGG